MEINIIKEDVDISSHIRELLSMLYFDHAASTSLCSEALDILHETMKDDYANPSAAHKWGKDLSEKTQQIKQNFLNFLNAPKESDFVFTSSASESNNTIIKGLGLQKGDKVFVSMADHASLVKPAKVLTESGVQLIELPLSKYGLPDIEQTLKVIDESVKLVLISSVNSQSGGILDILEFSKLLKDKNPNVHLHVDGVQSFGKFSLDLKNKNIDSLTISAHKMGGPKGVGGLWLLSPDTVVSLIDGGDQVKGLRSSTIAYPLIASFGAALKVVINNREKAYQRAQEYKDKIISEIGKVDEKISFPFEKGQCSPYILCIKWKGISSDIVLRHFEQRDVAISSTSACSSKIKGSNPTLKALGLPEDQHKFILRVSTGASTTLKEVDDFLSHFKEVYEELKIFIKR